MTTMPFDLSDEQVEQIAELVANRVAERLRGEFIGRELIDAAEVARRFSVSLDYVYDHADDLAVVRLGSGPKPRLRFDSAKVVERLGGSSSEKSQHKVKPVRSVRNKGDVSLLPIRGE